MDDQQKKMISECIDAHLRMIKYHRRAIIELSRRTILKEDIEMRPLDIKFADKDSNEG
jgi:hypothetical protein